MNPEDKAALENLERMIENEFSKKMSSETSTALRGMEYVALAGVAVIALNAAALLAVHKKNKNTHSETKTAVFVGGQLSPFRTESQLFDSDQAKTVSFLTYPYVVLAQNLKGKHVDWYNRATKKEILEQLAKEEYQSVVFIGHGSQQDFIARDDIVTGKDILERKIEKKSGELIQYTCGGKGEGPSLKEALLLNPEKGQHFNRIKLPPEIYVRVIYDLLKTIVRRK